MKIALLNDSHLGFRKSNKIFEEHILTFFDDFIQYCITNGIRKVVHAGDFFDVRTNVNVITLDRVKKRIIQQFAEHSIELYIAPGNHDCSYRHSVEANAIDVVFSEYENVHVYNKPTVITLEDSSNFLLVPWIGKEDETEFFSLIDDASLKTEVCIGHFEFAGFLYQAGIVADHGMDSKIFTPKFDVILSGHYHSKSTKGNIHYLGTQYDLTWADFDEKKYFHIFDTKTHEIEAIENRRKIFYKLFYDEQFVDETFLEEISKTCYNKKIIKVIILNRKNMIKFDSFMSKLYEQEPYDVSIVDESITRAKEEVKVDVTLLTKSTLEIIDSCLVDVDKSDYDEALIKKILHELYEIAEHD